MNWRCETYSLAVFVIGSYNKKMAAVFISKIHTPI